MFVEKYTCKTIPIDKPRIIEIRNALGVFTKKYKIMFECQYNVYVIVICH